MRTLVLTGLILLSGASFAAGQQVLPKAGPTPSLKSRLKTLDILRPFLPDDDFNGGEDEIEVYPNQQFSAKGSGALSGTGSRIIYSKGVGGALLTVEDNSVTPPIVNTSSFNISQIGNVRLAIGDGPFAMYSTAGAISYDWQVSYTQDSGATWGDYVLPDGVFAGNPYIVSFSDGITEVVHEPSYVIDQFETAHFFYHSGALGGDISLKHSLMYASFSADDTPAQLSTLTPTFLDFSPPPQGTESAGHDTYVNIAQGTRYIFAIMGFGPEVLPGTATANAYILDKFTGEIGHVMFTENWTTFGNVMSHELRPVVTDGGPNMNEVGVLYRFGQRPGTAAEPNFLLARFLINEDEQLEGAQQWFGFGEEFISLSKPDLPQYADLREIVEPNPPGLPLHPIVHMASNLDGSGEVELITLGKTPGDEQRSFLGLRIPMNGVPLPGQLAPLEDETEADLQAQGLSGLIHLPLGGFFGSSAWSSSLCSLPGEVMATFPHNIYDAVTDSFVEGRRVIDTH